MLISIIVPIYNVAPYVEQCLQSVASQTYQGAIECILVDDCGIDDSMAICERFVAQYNGPISFRILHHDHNRGLSAARNTGIDAAKGDYIYFLDSDDWILHECLELMVASATKYPQSQVVFAGANATFGNHDWLDYENKDLPEYSEDHEWIQVSMLKRFVFGMTAWNKLVLRDFVLNNTIYFVEGLVYEDEAWNFELSKFIRSASFVKTNTYIYNVHNNSIMTSTTGYVRWKRLFTLWNVLVKRIGNPRKQLQIKAITNFILSKTNDNFPYGFRVPLCFLFWKLGLKSCSLFSVFLFKQGVLAILCPSKYSNVSFHYCSDI